MLYTANHSLHMVIVPSAVALGRHCSTGPSSRKDGAKCHHDTARCQGMGRDSRTVPIDAPQLLTDEA
jgi:hypothetical protein